MADTRRQAPRDSIAAARPRQVKPHGGAPEPSSAESSPAESMSLTERIQAAAEREITAVEQILATLGGADPGESEGAARTLASLARTLRELVQIDATTTQTGQTNDEPAPRDVDELRRSLARKLEALAAADAAAVSGGE